MDPNSAAATPPATNDGVPPQTDNYGFPVAGEMSTDDMSDAELEAFVDKTLGAKGASNDGRTGADPTGTNDDGSGSATPPVPPKTPEAVPPPVPTPEAKPQPAPELAPEPPTEIPTLDTSDLWLEVKDTNGDTVRLFLDDGVPDDFLFTNDKQLYEVLDAFQEMKQLRREREADIEKAVTERNASETEQKTQQQTMDGWANEIQDLVDAGLIDKSDKGPADGKNYTQAEIAADPGLKTTAAVFDYMKAENAKRQTSGKPPLTSFTAAFTLYKKDSDSSAEVEALKQKNLIAKQRGAIVGGTSAPTSSDKPYVYKRGSARNIHQVDTSDI